MKKNNIKKNINIKHERELLFNIHKIEMKQLAREINNS